MRVSSVAILLLIGGSVAGAHEFWANGVEVDPATKRVCCGQHDAFLLAPEKVRVTKEGYRLEDTGETIAFYRAQPSPDGKIWAFRWGGETQCFFMPPENT